MEGGKLFYYRSCASVASPVHRYNVWQINSIEDSRLCTGIRGYWFLVSRHAALQPAVTGLKIQIDTETNCRKVTVSSHFSMQLILCNKNSFRDDETYV